MKITVVLAEIETEEKFADHAAIKAFVEKTLNGQVFVRRIETGTKLEQVGATRFRNAAVARAYAVLEEKT